MCEFCEDIRPIDNRKDFRDEDDLIMGGIQIVSDGGEYHLFDDCEDSYYSGISLENIHYCPFCGRKLKED